MPFFNRSRRELSIDIKIVRFRQILIGQRFRNKILHNANFVGSRFKDLSLPKDFPQPFGLQRPFASWKTLCQDWSELTKGFERCKEVTDIAQRGESFYLNTSFRLHDVENRGFFLEIDIIENHDNLSLAVADFRNSSVTFMPDVGVVVRETKTQEKPSKYKGSLE